jgi:hypothetical protein
MLRSLKELHGFALHATDGDVGHVEEFYFDDEKWAVRYLVVNTGGWLFGRKVLITPIAFGEPDWDGKTFRVTLSRQQVQESPEIDTNALPSRRHERLYFRFFGFPFYWDGASAWGGGAYPGMFAPLADSQGAVTDEADEAGAEEAGDESRLRSTKTVTGYGVEAADGGIGHVEDFVVDDGTWEIRYLVVETQTWIPGKEVLLPSRWVDRVSWEERRIGVPMDRETIRTAPEWDRREITREYEERLCRHYGRAGYWSDAASEQEVAARLFRRSA